MHYFERMLNDGSFFLSLFFIIIGEWLIINFNIIFYSILNELEINRHSENFTCDFLIFNNNDS